MSLVVSHQSAFLFWRACATPIDCFSSPKSPTAMTEAADFDDETLTELANLGLMPSAARPLHLLFARQEARSNRSFVRNHVATTQLPPKSLVQVSPHVLVASPELTFLQMAGVLSLEKLMLAGCELCGTYGISVSGELFERRPITSAKQLRMLVDKIQCVHGAKSARRALVYVADGAASPMEAKLFLLLCLPPKLGGYGLPIPALNAVVPLGVAAQSLYPCETCRCDLYWPESKFDVEYDGEAAHSGEAHARDIARRAALEEEGLAMKVLTFAQLADAEAFDLIARDIARRLGRWVRIRVENVEELRANLRLELGF